MKTFARPDANPVSGQTAPQELANSLVHGLGVVLSVAVTVIMVTFASLYGNVWHILGSGIFGGTLILLYTASTLYHWSVQLKIKKRMRIADHSAIFLLIAGTYTPFTFTTFDSGWGWTIFGVEWGLAALGIGTKVFSKYRYAIPSVLIYLGMGWLIVIAIYPLIQSLAFWGLMWLLAGGLFYSFGTIFYRLEHVGYNHAIWHAFVIGGSTCHFFSVLFYVIPSAS